MKLRSVFASFFLPIDYPASVTDDYLEFQICDTIQAMCSYLRGLLTTRATLIGAGVGKAEASATSATLQFGWIYFFICFFVLFFFFT